MGRELEAADSRETLRPCAELLLAALMEVRCMSAWLARPSPHCMRNIGNGVSRQRVHPCGEQLPAALMMDTPSACGYILWCLCMPWLARAGPLHQLHHLPTACCELPHSSMRPCCPLLRFDPNMMCSRHALQAACGPSTSEALAPPLSCPSSAAHHVKAHSSEGVCAGPQGCAGAFVGLRPPASRECQPCRPSLQPSGACLQG